MDPGPVMAEDLFAKDRSRGRYEGHYVDGTQTGMGIMTWADGRRYEG